MNDENLRNFFQRSNTHLKKFWRDFGDREHFFAEIYQRGIQKWVFRRYRLSTIPDVAIYLEQAKWIVIETFTFLQLIFCEIFFFPLKDEICFIFLTSTVFISFTQFLSAIYKVFAGFSFTCTSWKISFSLEIGIYFISD